MAEWDFTDDFTPDDFMEIVEHLEITNPELNGKMFAQAPKLNKIPENTPLTPTEKPKNENTIQALRSEIENLRREIEIRDAQLITMYHHLLNIIKKHV